MTSLWHRASQATRVLLDAPDAMMLWLLQSSWHADILVRCDDGGQIMVHSDVVCKGSEWFREKIQEARYYGHNVVDIEADHDLLYDVLATIYSGSLGQKYSGIDISTMLRGIKLWALADRLNLQSIKVAVYRKLAKYLQGLVIKWQRSMNYRGRITEDTVDEFRQTLALAYELQLPPVERLHIMAVKDSYFWVLGDSEFLEVFFEVPQFWEDVCQLKEETTVIKRTRVLEVCESCGIDPLASQPASHYAKVWVEGGQMVGRCYECHIAMVGHHDERHSSDGSVYENWEVYTGDD
ncbi:hypothetical protein F5Y04DRAFT_282999 [Hypomontagnella monticulosa]|nr:hypothetical protein F5Y04DRAFT_282999 [Hypomontagnella monticulosa]